MKSLYLLPAALLGAGPALAHADGSAHIHGSDTVVLAGALAIAIVISAVGYARKSDSARPKT